MKKITKGATTVSPKKLQKQMEKHLAKVTATAESLSRASGKEARRARQSLEDVISEAVETLNALYRDGSARVPALLRARPNEDTTADGAQEATRAGDAPSPLEGEAVPAKTAPARPTTRKSAPAKKAPAAKSAPATKTAPAAPRPAARKSAPAKKAPAVKSAPATKTAPAAPRPAARKPAPAKKASAAKSAPTGSLKRA